MPNEHQPGRPMKPGVSKSTSRERQAARVAEIAGKQAQLKREAADRRALREAAAKATTDNPPRDHASDQPASG